MMAPSDNAERPPDAVMPGGEYHLTLYDEFRSVDYTDKALLQIVNNTDKAEASGSTVAPVTDTPAQSVRFSSRNQEIEPPSSLAAITTLSKQSSDTEELSIEAQQELHNLSETLKHTRLQHRRMSNFAFEPVSLPASRVSPPASNPRSQGVEEL